MVPGGTYRREMRKRGGQAYGRRREAGMATTVPQISDAEWEVMKVVWDRQPVTAADVVDRLAREHRWRPRTAKTMLNRFLAKGAVDYTPEGKRYLYRARVSREACVRKESRSFL